MPLIAITAQSDLTMQYKGAHQYINLLELYRPISKWSTSIYDGSVIPKVIAKAFAMAGNDLPGAIHIEFPNDIASSLVNKEPIQTRDYDKKVLASEHAI